MKMNKFVEQYLETALWSSTDTDDDEYSKSYGYEFSFDERFDPYSITKEGLEVVTKDCSLFVELAGELLEKAGLNEDDAAHDFWMTRNGHGAGFWDRGLGELGERLTKIAKTFGESYLVVDRDDQFSVDQ